ncbi:MAG: CobW family GTP-binding protein [Pirellulales bacterium]
MRVPTNLITGFLGAGKTTAVRSLLTRRPAGARWSVFVNEYGMVSIDQALLDDASGDVEVQELGGGCFCCTTSVPLGPMLARFVRQTRPDRLLIEPSGAGHPARVIDTLRAPPFDELLELRATICLVDPKDFANPRVVNREVFRDQIEMADVVVLNWLDKREPALVARCREWLESFDPPKVRIVETQFGQLDPEWLDADATLVRWKGAIPTDHARPEERAAAPTLLHVDLADAAPAPGRPLRLANAGQGQWACGWIFSHVDRFDRDALFDLLGAWPDARRIKGVFHCDDDWWQVNRVDRESSLALSAYRRDSRVECICDAPQDWTEWEQRLLSCLVSR